MLVPQYASTAVACAAAVGCSASNDAPPTLEPADDPVAVVQVVQVADGVTAHTGARLVELRAVTCLDAGWLEQIACSPGSREHESLMVVEARPSNIHLALTLAGFESGEPGRWSIAGEELVLVPPHGDPVAITVRYTDADGQVTERPIAAWIRDHLGDRDFPSRTDWVFAGSHFAPNPEWMGPGEHYVADQTGSVIGLVTFGDEVIAFPEVIADEEAVHAPEWEVDIEAMPPLGTPVTIVLRGGS